MREYKKIKIETEELTKVLCDTCKKEIPIGSELITVESWGKDGLDFCSFECFLKWAKEESGTFDVSFPLDILNSWAREYARLKSRDSRLTDLESSNMDREEEKETK